MSRMTSSQVIALGEYLDTGFDPGRLTIPQLLGIFTFHDVKYPSQHNKGKLVQLFNEEIAPRSAQYKRERLQRENSNPSEDGITDGVTGRPINEQESTAPRRSSRRSSRAPSMETSPVRSEEPKRRRSSAQPTYGRAAAVHKSTAQPVLLEESEPDSSEPEHIVVQKRPKKLSTVVDVQARRVSQKIGPGNDDSGWEDHNIFQSGAESSSPARPQKSLSVRKSSTRKSRITQSAPPDPPQSLPGSPSSSVPQSAFEPRLPVGVARRLRLSDIEISPQRFAMSPKGEDDDGLSFDADESGMLGTDVGDLLDDMEEEEEAEEDQNALVSRKIAEGGRALVRRSVAPVRSTPLWMRVLLLLFAIAGSGIAGLYKMECEPIGYCDTDSQTNSALEALKVKYRVVDECRKSITLGENRTGVGADCPPLAVVPLPHPTTCTPCPEHASCERTSVTCDNGYLLHPHPFSYIPFAPELANGLPGLGPVAFPPRCVEDPRRKRNIGAMGKSIEATLATERGRRLCFGRTGSIPSNPADGGEAKRWGFDVVALKESLRAKTPEAYRVQFDDTFKEAIDQLLLWSSVITGIDSEGHQYLASQKTDMDLSCRVLVGSRDLWETWRTTVLGAVVFLVGVYLSKLRLASQRAEGRRVSELVQIALDTLRHQELAHHTDPITAPQPYLSSLQLRDLILQDEHSIPARRRLWDRVERVVEGNANVRANLEEMPGGDEARVWRWVGSAGKAPNRRLQSGEGKIIA